MKSILLFIERINDTNSDPIISVTKTFFSIFGCIFEMYLKFWTFWKKKMTLIGFCISAITDFENVVR